MPEDAANAGSEFEREVAAIYRTLGADVEYDIAIAGKQVDVVVHEKMVSGRSVTTMVECKAWNRPVGVEVVNAFAGLLHLLRQRAAVDGGVVVSLAGFTRSAREAAEAHGVQLMEIADLRQRVFGKADAVEAAAGKVREEDDRQKQVRRPPRIFVAMPFSRDFNDVYLLGIRDVAERLGYVVERVDEIEHNGYIVDTITERLRTCDVLVADTTTRNPNVFYEIGYGHALDTPTVLICREGEEMPFDVRAVNHISYASIVDLRERLERRLRSMLNGNDPSPR